MDPERLKANLNLSAVLPNLEDLVRYDTQAAEQISGWNLTLQFKTCRGPSAC